MDYLVCIKARSLQCLARDPCTRAHRARTFDCEVSAHARARAHMGHAWRCSCWCFEGRCARCCMKISASCATGLMLAALWGAQGPSSGIGLLRKSGQPSSAAAESALPQGHLDSFGYLMMPLGFTVGDLMDSLWRVCCCGLYPGGGHGVCGLFGVGHTGPDGHRQAGLTGPSLYHGRPHWVAECHGAFFSERRRVSSPAISSRGRVSKPPNGQRPRAASVGHYKSCTLCILVPWVATSVLLS